MADTDDCLLFKIGSYGLLLWFFPVSRSTSGRVLFETGTTVLNVLNALNVIRYT